MTSFEGFRHDYLNEHQLPTINQFRNEGVQATHGMRPTFTTMTFPNHISIATGVETDSYELFEIVNF
jgi:predicted AlkP superfamily pyrophosphatase or phosphodiesterase